MARLNAKWLNFSERGQVWDHFWQDSASAAPTNSYSNTGSGTIHIAGSGPYSKTMNWPVDGLIIKVAGSATVTKRMNYVGSGTILISGTASDKETFNYLPSGTILISGSAFVTKRMNYVPSGTIRISGSASDSEVFNYQASGTILISGSAGIKKTKTWPVDGLIIKVSGSATTFKSVSFVYVGSGTILISGSAQDTELFNYQPTGRIYIGGAASVSKTMVYPIVGQIIKVAGAASTFKSTIFRWISDGLIIKVSGSALDRETFNYQVSGTIRISGSAFVTKRMNYVPTGTILIAGAATTSRPIKYAYVPAGIIIKIAATPNHSRAYGSKQPIGIIKIAASASVTKKMNYQPVGTLVLAGTALKTAKMNYLPIIRAIRLDAVGETYKKTKAWAMSGTIRVAGTASDRETFNYVAIISSIKVAGAALVTKKMNYLPVIGRITLGASLTPYSKKRIALTQTKTVMVGGAIQWYHRLRAYQTKIGTIRIAASTVTTHKKAYVPSGGLRLSGTALKTAKMSYLPVIGKIALFGTNTYSKKRIAATQTSTVLVSGTSAYKKSKVVSIQGRIRVAASGTIRKTMNYPAGGTVQIFAFAAHSRKKIASVATNTIKLFAANTTTVSFSPLISSDFYIHGTYGYEATIAYRANDELDVVVANSWLSTHAHLLPNSSSIIVPFVTLPPQVVSVANNNPSIVAVAVIIQPAMASVQTTIPTDVVIVKAA